MSATEFQNLETSGGLLCPYLCLYVTSGEGASLKFVIFFIYLSKECKIIEKKKNYSSSQSELGTIRWEAVEGTVNQLCACSMPDFYNNNMVLDT